MFKIKTAIVAALIGATSLTAISATAATQVIAAGKQAVSQFITANDGTQLYYKDWGPKDGPVVSFSHGWPLNSDSWESQMQFLAERGYRVIAYDRRGHGRSGQAWANNTMDQYADDLAAVLNALNVREVSLVGFSTGGGEVTRYIGRHGTGRVKKLILVSAVTPIMVRNADNPTGVPIDVFDGLRKASLDNRSQLYKDIASGPFFGFNRPGSKSSQGLIDSFWVQGMQGSHKATYDSIKAFSESNFVKDLKLVNVPTLIIHGDDDQIVPIETSARAAVKLVKERR